MGEDTRLAVYRSDEAKHTASAMTGSYHPKPLESESTENVPTSYNPNPPESEFTKNVPAPTSTPAVVAAGSGIRLQLATLVAVGLTSLLFITT